MADSLLLNQEAEFAERDLADALIGDLREGAGEDQAPEPRWGVRSDGTPRNKPGPKPGQASGGRARGRTRPARSSSSTTRRAAKPKEPEGPDYVGAIVGLGAMVAAPLAMLAPKNPVFAVDAATISVHIRPFAEGIVAGAGDLPQVQAMLDKIVTIGPWGTMLAPAVAMLAQILANHGVIPVGFLGTQSPQAMIAAFQAMQPGA